MTKLPEIIMKILAFNFQYRYRAPNHQASIQGYIPLCSPKSLAHLAMWILISGFKFFLSSPPALFPSSSTGGMCTLFLPISCTSSCAQSSVCTVFSPAVASKSARSFESSYEGGSGWRTFDLRCRTKSKAAIAKSATTPTPPSEAPIMSGR